MHNSNTFSIASVMILTVLVACNSTQLPGNQESLQVTQSQSSSIDRQSDTRIVILNDTLRAKMVVHTPTLYRSSGGPLRIEVPVAYLGEEDCKIEYRFRFFGFEGIESNNDETDAADKKSWKKGTLEAMAFTHLKGKALDTSAQNFRLEIRKPL